MEIIGENKEDILQETLTSKQERFCRLYTQNKALFGNGTLSYAEAYNYNLDELDKTDAKYEYYEENGARKSKKTEESSYDKAYNVCASNANRLLRNEKITPFLTKYLNEVLTDEIVDSNLAEIILNGKDADRVSAIKEYNKLKQRIIEKSEIKGDLTIIALTEEQKEGLRGLIKK